MTKNYYFLLTGSIVFPWINFSLLVLATSDKLKMAIPVNTMFLYIIFLPLAFFTVWFIGWFLDSVMKINRSIIEQNTERTPLYKEIIERLERIEKKVK